MASLTSPCPRASAPPNAANPHTTPTPAATIAQLAKDSNASAFEAGLEALRMFVDRYPAAPSSAEEVVPLLIKHGLSGRPAVVEKVVQIILLFMEVRNTAAPAWERVLVCAWAVGHVVACVHNAHLCRFVLLL